MEYATNSADDAVGCLYCGKYDDTSEQKESKVKWVQSDDCNKERAEVSADIEDLKWSCRPCLANKNVEAVMFKTPCAKASGDNAHSTVEMVSVNNLQTDSAFRLENKSVTSRGSSVSAKNRVRLELELLEEKRKVEEELLNKKYNLLSELNDIKSDEESQEELEIVKRNRTCQWANCSKIKDFKVTGAEAYTAKGTEGGGRYIDLQQDKHQYRSRVQHNGVQQNMPQNKGTNVHHVDVNAAVSRPPDVMPTQFTFPQPGTAQMYSARSVISRDLPTFNGRPEEWPLFSNDENLLRLQCALKGKALECVHSKLLVPDLVPEVIDTLRMLFGRPDHIINNSIAKLRAQPNVNPNKMETLIALALEVKNLTATMKV